MQFSFSEIMMLGMFVLGMFVLALLTYLTPFWTTIMPDRVRVETNKKTPWSGFPSLQGVFLIYTMCA